MEWDDLRYLLAVSRARTASGAASALSVTHTTVGRRLRACEAQLGVQLFDRTPDGLHATAAGLELIEVAERMEGELHAAESRVMGRDAALKGALRVSLLDYTLWALGDAFARFVERHPRVELTLTASLEQVSLTRREADVAMRLTGNPPEHLIGRKVGSVGFAVYAHRRLVEQVGTDAPYGAYPWLGWDQRVDGRWFDGWLAEHAPGARIVARIDESAIIRRQAVCSGLGVFLMPCFEADQVPELRRLGPVHFHQPLWLLTLAELRHTSRVRAFVDHMVEELVPLAAQLDGNGREANVEPG